MDYFDWAIKVSRKRLRRSSLEVYRSMWNGYVARLATPSASGGAAVPGEENVDQMLDAIKGAGEYSAQKRVFTLVQWTYGTLQSHGMELTNPTRLIYRLFIPEVRAEHDMLDTTWQDRMVSAAAEVSKGWKGLRLKAIVTVLCETALKNHEVITLRITNLRGLPPTELVAGQGSKERAFPLSTRAADTLREWLAVRPANPGDYLFVADSSGRPMDPATLWRQLKKVTTQMPGSESLKHFGTGVIRATKAKELEQRGESTSSIAGFLGHRQEASTGELLQRVKDRSSVSGSLI